MTATVPTLSLREISDLQAAGRRVPGPWAHHVIPFLAPLGLAYAVTGQQFLAGVAVAPIALAWLNAVRAQIGQFMTLSEDDAAARLIAEIEDRASRPGQRGETFRRQLRAAAELDEVGAPLLHRPDVRAAIAKALAVTEQAA
jgi:hypothetical protein